MSFVTNPATTSAIILIVCLVATTDGQRTVCPVGWKRLINKCYKVVSHPALKTHGDAVDVCQAESGADTVLTIPKTSRINQHIASLLVEVAGRPSFIGLRDNQKEGLYIWDDQFFQNSSVIESPEFLAIVDNMKASNTEDLDCVEITSTGEWMPVDCTGPTTRVHTVCMQHILKPQQNSNDLICGLNGEQLVLD